jgi:MFS family permease
MPAKAGIQYAVASQFESNRHGLLGHPLSRMTTSIDRCPALDAARHPPDGRPAMDARAATDRAAGGQVESTYAWLRLAASTALGTVGCVGMWSYVVALPAVQADLGLARADASLPFTFAMLGFGAGCMFLGRLVDRIGIVVPMAAAAVVLGLGYIAAGYSANLWQLTLAHAMLIGVGSSAAFGPLVADLSRWFARRRGIAVAICSCGNYLAGAIWPPILQYLIETAGWRAAYIDLGIVCIATMLPLTLMLRRPAPMDLSVAEGAAAVAARDAVGLSPGALQALLAVAGIACCVAMAMPQVHIVAYCGDLGYGPARGAQMLSLMLSFGLVSRLACGLIADRIGGIATLLISSGLQALALLLYLGFDSLASLYVISALFGLFQGGLVPVYAIIVREYFAPAQAGTRLGVVLMATTVGMALGGWMSGAIFDLTGSYHAAFVNGLLWNFLNIAIALWIVLRRERRLALA